MILRVVRFRVPARHSHHVFAGARRLVGPDRPDGLLHASFGRQQDGGSDSFVIVTEWRDLEAVYGWVGGPGLLSAVPTLGPLAEFATDVDIQHYEDPGPRADGPPTSVTSSGPAVGSGGSPDRAGSERDANGTVRDRLSV